MKLAEGVDLHFIKTEQFKTNHLTFRFSGQRQVKNLARRALVAQMLATASENYPTTKHLREHLATLYGAHLSTNIITKGNIHIIDIDISFVSNRYAFGKKDILIDILHLLNELLFHPLIFLEKYQTKTFDLEKANLIRYVEADKQDQFYISNLGLQELYYDDEALKHPKYGNEELIARENAFTAYQEFQKMLREDKIDIFLLGDFDDYQAARQLISFSFSDRPINLQAFYKQDFTNVVREQVLVKENNQSILQLGYHIPIYYGEENYYAMLIAEGILGGFSHSKLFTEIREKDNLAYTIDSRYDAFTGFLRIYAGIDRENRAQIFKAITKQINELKMGRFSTQIIKQTKGMIISHAKMSLDSPKMIIEQTYNRLLLGHKGANLDDFIGHINNVTKRDIIAAIGLVKLQAVYFLEGEYDESSRKS